MSVILNLHRRMNNLMELVMWLIKNIWSNVTPMVIFREILDEFLS